MKSFKDSAAQGDVFIFRIDALPGGLTAAKPEEGKFVVAHSETGHHHTIEATKDVSFLLGPDPNIAYLEVRKPSAVVLNHERSWDTHEALQFPKGIFQINRQREFVPDGWRTVAD